MMRGRATQQNPTPEYTITLNLPFMMDCDSGEVKWDLVSKKHVQHGRNTGDGINVLEEYRGFEINGVHTRLSPTVKDLFIYSSLGPSDASYIEPADIGNAGNLSGITVHQVQEFETDDNGVINFTRKNVQDATRQFTVHIYADDDDPPFSGRTFGIAIGKV